MCGRFNIISDAAALIEAFGILDASLSGVEVTARYNIAPSQDILAVRTDPETGVRGLCVVRWGLIPFWAKDKAIGYKMINARAETVAEKPAYRAAFKRRRCLIPASGFYEWQQTDGKQAYNVRRKDGGLLAFAGLWEHWQGSEETIESATIVVTRGNELMASIHERMPVILSPRHFDTWLDPGIADKDTLLPLLVPYAGNGLEAYPVTRAVNNPRNTGAELVRRISVGNNA